MARGYKLSWTGEPGAFALTANAGAKMLERLAREFLAQG